MKNGFTALALVVSQLLAAGSPLAFTARAFAADPVASMMPTSSSLPHLSVTRTHSFTVPLPKAHAFTLFEPVGEKLWAEGWSPVFATPGDATLSDNTVFTRTVIHHGQPAQTSVWLVTHYDQAGGVIEYRAVVPGLRVSRITVRCRESQASETSVEVTYRHTSLSNEGDAFVQDVTEEHYRASIEEWNTAIRAYLARGTPATP